MYIYTHIHTYIYVCVYVYICIYAYTHIYNYCFTSTGVSRSSLDAGTARLLPFDAHRTAPQDAGEPMMLSFSKAGVLAGSNVSLQVRYRKQHFPNAPPN